MTSEARNGAPAGRKRRGWIRGGGPALVLMVLIFVGSTDLLAVQHTSRFIGPFLRWLVPDITEPAIQTVQWMVRKCGHAGEYALLAMLFWRWWNAPRIGQARPWPVRMAWASWVCATLYALSDEWHQSFVPSRDGQWSDVLIDASGAALGIGLLWITGRIRGRWVDGTDPSEYPNRPR